MRLPVAVLLGAFATSLFAAMPPRFASFVLDYQTPVDPALQAKLEAIDATLRAKHGMAPDTTAAGVLDLRTLRLALLRPDKIEYAASIPKIAILFAWFDAHRELATALDPATRHELGLMIKVSDNEIAAKYSRQLGLKNIQALLNAQGFYDPQHGGGLWIGKHYGQGTERYLDPVGGHSHGATVRQLVRFYLLLEQDRLVSPAASQAMREIFASPDIAPINDKFVKGLAGRPVEVRRKAGWWDTWFGDTAVVTGPERHYIVVALTHDAHGDDYLAELAAAVDDALREN